MAEPQAKVIISGTVKDFKQIDNLYAAVKREGIKLLDQWQLSVQVTYEESAE